jgi:hypothetical protein
MKNITEYDTVPGNESLTEEEILIQTDALEKFLSWAGPWGEKLRANCKQNSGPDEN